jgi:predicted metal-dependent hydrolase
MSLKKVEEFILKNKNWILKHYKKNIEIKNNSIKLSIEKVEEYKRDARILVKEKLDYFNQFYNFKYKKVSIKNCKTKWGSCSSNKNLTFNFQIVFLEKEMQDYLIVHELCHLKEFNHSNNFWLLVEKTIPDYLSIRKKMREMNFIYE